MNYEPLVSIVTVSFNQGKFLEETISSVLNQKYKNIQYIIFDGGSTDNSHEIIEKYKSRIDFIHIGPDGGPCAALNSGFSHAKGEIHAYINSDDVLEAHAVESWVKALADPKVDIVYGDIEIIDEIGKPTTLPGKRVTTFLAGPFTPKMYAAGASVIPQQASAWRAKVFQRVGGFEKKNKTCWDKEFFAKAAILGFRFTRVSETLAKFRIHSCSISGTNRNNDERIIDHKRIDQEFRSAGLKPGGLEKFFLRKFSQMYRLARYAFR